MTPCYIKPNKEGVVVPDHKIRERYHEMIAHHVDLGKLSCIPGNRITHDLKSAINAFLVMSSKGQEKPSQSQMIQDCLRGMRAHVHSNRVLVVA